LDGEGNIISRFVFGLRSNVPEYMVRNGVTYRILTDQLGSPRAVIDNNTGVIVARFDYDEWGVVVAETNSGFQPFGFAGGLSDSMTGLVRFGTRDYAPTSGRWIAKDRVGLGGGSPNLYEYTVNDPINELDPTGEFSVYGWSSIEGEVSG